MNLCLAGSGLNNVPGDILSCLLFSDIPHQTVPYYEISFSFGSVGGCAQYEHSIEEALAAMVYVADFFFGFSTILTRDSSKSNVTRVFILVTTHTDPESGDMWHTQGMAETPLKVLK